MWFLDDGEESKEQTEISQNQLLVKDSLSKDSDILRIPFIKDFHWNRRYKVPHHQRAFNRGIRFDHIFSTLR